jgi:hypothetical protein
MAIKSLKPKTGKDKIEQRLSFLITTLTEIKNSLVNLNKNYGEIEKRIAKKDPEILLALSTLQANINHSLLQTKFVTKKTEEKTLFILLKHTSDLIDLSKKKVVKLESIPRITKVLDKVISNPTNFVNLQPHDNIFQE